MHSAFCPSAFLLTTVCTILGHWPCNSTQCPNASNSDSQTKSRPYRDICSYTLKLNWSSMNIPGHTSLGHVQIEICMYVRMSYIHIFEVHWEHCSWIGCDSTRMLTQKTFKRYDVSSAVGGCYVQSRDGRIGGDLAEAATPSCILLPSWQNQRTFHAEALHLDENWGIHQVSGSIREFEYGWWIKIIKHIQKVDLGAGASYQYYQRNWFGMSISDHLRPKSGSRLQRANTVGLGQKLGTPKSDCWVLKQTGLNFDFDAQHFFSL